MDFLYHAQVAQKVPSDPKLLCGLPLHDTKSPSLTEKSIAHRNLALSYSTALVDSHFLFHLPLPVGTCTNKGNFHSLDSEYVRTELSRCV